MPMVSRRTLAVAIAGLLSQGASGLYADEVGKLDWHRQNLGRFSSAAFDGRGGITVVGEVRLGWQGKGVFLPRVLGVGCCGEYVCPTAAVGESLTLFVSPPVW